MRLAIFIAWFSLTIPSVEAQIGETEEAVPPLPVPPELSLELESGDAESEAPGVLLFRAMQADYQFGEYDEALVPARVLVDIMALEYGEESLEMAAPLTDLAMIQEQNEDFVSAESNFGRAVLLIETHRGPVDADLIAPLEGLGDVYQATGRHEQAIEAYDRARQITRREHGLYTLKQIPMLHSAAKSHTSLRALMEADRRHLLAFDLEVREYGIDSVEIVPALLRLAQWQELMYEAMQGDQRIAYSCLVEEDMSWAGEEPARCRRMSVRDLYGLAIRLLEEAYGENDPHLIEPLRDLADTYYAKSGRWVQRTFAGEPHYEYQTQHTRGKKYLERAVDIEMAQQEARPEDRAALMSEMGDWYTVFSRNRKAATGYYRKAWEYIRQAEGVEAANQAFAEPKRLLYKSQVRPPRRSPGPGEVTMGFSDDGVGGDALGYVLLGYTVTAEGDVEDIELLESSPEKMTRQARAIMKALRLALFRPRLVDGEVVAAPNQKMQEEFHYRE